MKNNIIINIAYFRCHNPSKFVEFEKIGKKCKFLQKTIDKIWKLIYNTNN